MSLEVLAQFKKLKTLTTDVQVIADALKGSRLVELDGSCTKVKPRTKAQRNTIILREISSEADPAKIKKLFEVSVRWGRRNERKKNNERAGRGRTSGEGSEGRGGRQLVRCVRR